MKPTIYSVCDFSNVALLPWAVMGFPCVSIDLEERERPNKHIEHWKTDIKSLSSLPNAGFVMGWPPCTDLCRSGARWWPSKGSQALIEALTLVNHVIRLIGRSPGIIENPVGRLSSYWRKPDIIVSPWEFAGFIGPMEAYTKKTCLWFLNGAKPPIKAPWIGQVDTTRIHYASGLNRARIRSKSPVGLAWGLYYANSALLKY